MICSLTQKAVLRRPSAIQLLFGYFSQLGQSFGFASLSPMKLFRQAMQDQRILPSGTAF